MKRSDVGPRLDFVEHIALDGRPGGIPCRLQCAKPFRKIRLLGTGRKRDASTRNQGREYRYLKAMAIIDGADAKAAVLGGKPEPGLSPPRSSKHIVMAVGNNLRLRCCAGRLQNERGRVPLRLPARRRTDDWYDQPLD